ASWVRLATPVFASPCRPALTPRSTPTAALTRFAHPGPGSKNPEPAADNPVTRTLMDGWNLGMVLGTTETGIAGGGASSLATWRPQELATFVYSWIVHIDMPSLGSRLV